MDILSRFLRQPPNLQPFTPMQTKSLSLLPTFLVSTLAAFFEPLAMPQRAAAQAFPIWTGSGTNWSSSPTNWSPAYGYGQLQWANAGSTTSWNNLGTVSQWRFYFSGDTSYTVGGGNVNFFDWSGTNGGILVGSSDGLSTGNQTINLNVAFADTGARTAFILTRGSGNLTFGGTVRATGNVTAVGIGGSNAASIISFNNTISGNKPIVIGTNSLNGGVAGMTNTRVIFAGDNTYEGATTVANGILTIAHNNALGSTAAGTTVNSGASLRMSNNITVTGEALTLNGALVAGVLRSESGTNAYLGTITLGTAITSLGAATNASLTISNVTAGSNELWVIGDGNTTIAGTVSSAAATTIVKTNTGVLTLEGAGSLGGNKYIRQGTIRLANDNAFSSGGTVIVGGLSGTTNDTILELDEGITYSGAVSIQAQAVVGGTRTLAYNAGTGTGTLSGTIALSNNVALDVAAGGTLHSSGVITSTGGITKTGAGTVTLSGDNAFSGDTAVSAGTLKLDSAVGGALAATESVTVGDTAVLLLSQSNQVNDSAAVTLSGGTIQRDGEVNEVFGNLNLTQASFLDYGSGPVGELRFGTYTAEFLLTVGNFAVGNTLIFGSDLTSVITDEGLFSFSSAFSYDWDEGNSTFTITAIPEPSAYAAAAGLLGMMLWPARRRIVRDTKRILGLRAPMRDRLRRAA